MATNIVGLLDNPGDADAAVRDLQAGGFNRDSITALQRTSHWQTDTFAQLWSRRTSAWSSAKSR